VDSRIGEIEKARIDAYSALNTQLHALLDTHLPSLHEETAKLVKALRQPSARGRWGEMQLKRVVEMAGMLEHCDFSEQVSYTDAEEKRQRPDMIVHLPGGKQIVVDAKAPLSAYLEAIEATEETARQVSLAQHTQQLKKHIQSLGQKSYWAQFQPTPEFVILFLPGETFLSAAFTEDPNLLEFAIAHKVIPATPTTLIALLKAVAYGWQQEVLTENAKAISTLGKELYERLVTLGTHWANVGKGLEAATKAYNEATGSLESRVLVSARRLRELRHLDKELPLIQSVDRIPRQLQEPDMLSPSGVQEAAGQDGAGNAG
jgi:DNA recombination protein RmuC